MGWVFTRNVAIALAALAGIVTLGFSGIAVKPLLGTSITLVHLVGVANLLIAFWLWKRYI